MRNAFGHLLIRPEDLDFRGRVDCIRWLVGHLQAQPQAEVQWLGRTLRQWLEDGGDLAALLGVKPARGSRLTAQFLVRQARLDVDLLRAAIQAGSARKAAELIAEGPRSAAAFTRASKRRRVSRDAR
jgi:hypothetical protein